MVRKNLLLFNPSRVCLMQYSNKALKSNYSLSLKALDFLVAYEFCPETVPEQELG